MAEVRPLRGIRFTQAAGPMGALTAPPYHTIGEEQRRRLAARNPRNIVHLDLPEGGPERYRIAAEKLEAWIRDGFLAQERSPALYLYRQTFQTPDARMITRTGFLGLLRLEGEGGGVLHHERMLPLPLEDRLRLIRATRTQLSPVFVLYSDPDAGATRALEAGAARDRPGMRPFAPGLTARRATELSPGIVQEFTDEEGVRHWLLPVTDEQRIAEAQRVLASRPLLIVDGRHRYRAALEYRDRMRLAFGLDDPELPESFVLTCFVRMEDPGLVVLPAHRVVKAVPGAERRDTASIVGALFDRFDIESMEIPPGAHAAPILAPARQEPGKKIVIGARFAGDPRLHVLRLREGGEPFAGRSLEEPLRGLDVAVLPRLILEPEFGIEEASARAQGRLLYERDAASAAAMVEKGEAAAAFFLRPVPIPALFDVAALGLHLPLESTVFTPKIGSGLVLYRLGV
jgi:uncharacterized protein (DUF1015 family)